LCRKISGEAGKGALVVDFKTGEMIRMKKPHPCGENRWEILRVGMDFRLRCTKCKREVMTPRRTVEKGFKGYC